MCIADGRVQLFTGWVWVSQATSPPPKHAIHKHIYYLILYIKHSPGHCRNMSQHYLCHHHADGVTIDAERDNLKLNGYFECNRSRCVKIKRAFSCDRYCPKITTTSVNVLIMEGDKLVTAECDAAYAFNEARGREPGIRINPPRRIWDDGMGPLLTNCHSVLREPDNKLR